MDLVEFLRAQLDEDEAAAHAAAEAVESAKWSSAGGAALGDPDYVAFRSFVARHDPARVLREVEAKRAILAMWETFAVNFTHVGENVFEFAKREALEDVLERMGAVYSDHPDYQQEWKP